MSRIYSCFYIYVFLFSLFSFNCSIPALHAMEEVPRRDLFKVQLVNTSDSRYLVKYLKSNNQGWMEHSVVIAGKSTLILGEVNAYPIKFNDQTVLLKVMNYGYLNSMLDAITDAFKRVTFQNSSSNQNLLLNEEVINQGGIISFNIYESKMDFINSYEYMPIHYTSLEYCPEFPISTLDIMRTIPNLNIQVLGISCSQKATDPVLLIQQSKEIIKKALKGEIDLEEIIDATYTGHLIDGDGGMKFIRLWRLLLNAPNENIELSTPNCLLSKSLLDEPIMRLKERLMLTLSSFGLSSFHQSQELMEQIEEYKQELIESQEWKFSEKMPGYKSKSALKNDHSQLREMLILAYIGIEVIIQKKCELQFSK